MELLFRASQACETRRDEKQGFVVNFCLQHLCAKHTIPKQWLMTKVLCFTFALKVLVPSFLLSALGKTDSSKEDHGDEDRDAHDHVDIRPRRLKSFVLVQAIVIAVVVDVTIIR